VLVGHREKSHKPNGAVVRELSSNPPRSPRTGLLKLKEGIIYGPVNSRRLGKSLGINLLPCENKVCSFDCIYCQYGPTRRKMIVPEAGIFPPTDDVLQEIERALEEHKRLDHITFSGNGEPTLHPSFERIVEKTIDLRNRLKPGVPTAILTNSSRLSEKSISAAVSLLDRPIGKLDAGDVKTFRRISRPHPDIDFDEMVNGMRRTRNITIQSVLFDGPVTNSRGKNLDNLIDAMSIADPTAVQIYSTVRPVPSASIIQLPMKRLQEIASSMQKRLGVPVKAY
jgi:wyosine [tRNA(Phe)-imidazoG37] synthetase (radical SAM superfamily)